MGQSSSTPVTAVTTTTDNGGKKTPNCKICCACPAERRARDECTLLKHMEDCQPEINAFYACLLTEGFSQADVDKLRGNTKRM